MYALIKKEGIPEYLNKEWRENRWVARFKLGNGMRKGQNVKYVGGGKRHEHV